MTYVAKVLRSADDIALQQQGPTTSSGRIMVDTCGTTPTPTSYDVLKKLSESDPVFGVRLREGLPFQTYDGATWVDADPLLWGYAPMLCRSINVVEHAERPGLFSVDYETSGFGQPTSDNTASGTLLGTDDIQLSVSHRPRQVAAYRSEPNVPTSETLNTSVTPAVFDVDADWHDGTDIGGRYVDINTAPLSISIDQTVLTLSFPIRYPYRNWDGTWGGGCRSIPFPMIGSRNAEEMLGFGVGQLLCETIDVQPLHHEYRLSTIVLVYDEYSHALQVPKVVSQFATPTYTNPTTGASHVLEVFWQQPYDGAFYLNSTASAPNVEDLIGDPGLFSYLQRFAADCT